MKYNTVRALLLGVILQVTSIALSTAHPHAHPPSTPHPPTHPPPTHGPAHPPSLRPPSLRPPSLHAPFLHAPSPPHPHPAMQVTRRAAMGRFSVPYPAFTGTFTPNSHHACTPFTPAAKPLHACHHILHTASAGDAPCRRGTLLRTPPLTPAQTWPSTCWTKCA